MQRGCIARFPACPAPPQARTLTDAGSPGSGSAGAAARPDTAPAFRQARQASERACERGARGAQGACAVRRTIPGDRWEEGLRESRRLQSSCRRGVRVAAAHGPAGLGTVRRPKGEEASRIARACAVQRTRLINRGCLGVRAGERRGLNTRRGSRCWRLAHLHNPSAGQRKTSRTGGCDLHIPGRGCPSQRSD